MVSESKDGGIGGVPVTPPIDDVLAKASPERTSASMPFMTQAIVARDDETPESQALERMLKRENQSEVLMATMSQASGKNPDAVAEADKVGKSIGVDVTTAMNNMIEARRRALMNDVRNRNLPETSPMLAESLSDPRFANVAHDDIENLSSMEKTFRYFGDNFDNLTSAIAVGMLQTDQAYMNFEWLQSGKGGDIDPIFANTIKAYGQGIEALHVQPGWTSSFGTVLGQQVRTLPEVAPYVATGAAAGAARGLFLGTVAGAVAPPTEAVTAPLGFLTGAWWGAGVGAKTGFGVNTAMQEAGGIYASTMRATAESAARKKWAETPHLPNERFTFDEFKGDDAVARPIAYAGGAINGIVETMLLGTVTKSARGILAMTIRGEANKVFARKMTQKGTMLALWKIGKQMGLEVGGNVVEEVSQEIISIIADQLAVKMSDPNAVGRFDTEEGRAQVIEELWDIAIQTAQGMIIMGGTGPAINLYVHRQEIRDMRREQKFLTDLISTAEDSPLRKRAPGTLEAFLARTARDTKAENIYINADTLREELEKTKTSMEALEAVVPGIKAQLDAATTSDDDVMIPTATFAAKLVGTELGSSLRQHIRLSAPALSLFEQRKQAKYLKQQVEDAKKLLDESNGADADFVRSANVVRAKIEKQLADIGSYSDDEAATMAEMATAWYVTTAVQNNMTPEQVHAIRPNVIESQADYEKRLNDTYDQGGNLRTDNAKFIEKFKNTKTVDKDGKIIRLYHATTSPDDFDALVPGPTGIFGRGVYLTDSAEAAGEMVRDKVGARVFPQYAAINNPLVTTAKGFSADVATALNMTPEAFSKMLDERIALGEKERDIFTDLLSKAGYDGVQIKYGDSESHYVAFNADQLESAVLEQGTFSQNMSTRLPAGKNALENGVTELLTADYEAFLRDPTFIAKNLELFKKLGAPIRIDESKSPQEQIEQILDHMASNLLFIHDEMDAAQRARAKQWYMGGRKMVDWMAARHGISPMQAAALYAVLSPQKDWFENVSLGNRIADIASTQRNRTMSLSMQAAMIKQLESEALAVTQQMNSVAIALKQASAEMQRLQELGAPIVPVLEKPKRSATKTVKNAYGVQVRKAEAAAKKYARQLQQVTDKVTSLTAALTDLQAGDTVAQAYATKKIGEAKTAIEDIGTRTLGQLLDAGKFDLAAIVVRWTDFEINSPNYSVITPEGGAGALRLTQAGTPSSIRWGTYEAISKALSVFTDGSVLNVHYQIGNEHKVRNFYNNLFDPSDERFATIDTHAIAAAYMLPLSGADALVVHGLGGLTSNSGVGLGGAYALIFEAYKRAAKSRDVSPREMQSITWEAIRGMFEAANKKTLKAPVTEVWQQYKDGEISIGRARRKVVNLASGITTPAWVGTPTSIPPGSGYSGTSQVDGDKHVPPQPVRLEVKSNFEVAPNPKDKKAVERWNMLTPDQQADVSMQVAKVTVRRVLDHWGATAQFVPQEGGYEGISSASFALLLDPSVRTRAICQDLCEALSQASIFTISQNPFGDQSIEGSMSTESESVVIGLAPGTTPAQIRDLFEKGLVPIGVTAHSTVEGFMVIVVDGDATATFEAIQKTLKGDPRIVEINKGKAWTAFDASKQRNKTGNLGQDNRRRRIGVLRREANAIIDAYVAVKQYKSGGYPSTAGNSAASPRPGPNDQVNQPPLPSKAPAAFRVTRLASIPTDGIKPLVVVRNALNEKFGTQVIDRLIALGDAGKRGGVVIVSNVIELASKFKELTGRDLDTETLESQKADRLKAQGTARAWVLFAEAKKLVDFGKIKTLEDAAILAEANYQDTINRVPKFDAQAYVDGISNVALEFIPADFRALVRIYREGIHKGNALQTISDLVLKIRQYNIERWETALEDADGAYMADPFFRSYVATNLLNGLRPDYINEGQIFHPAALSLLYAQAQTGKVENFEKVYSAILLKVTENLVKLGDEDNGWRKVPMTKQDDPLFDEAVANVRSISHKDWCTRTYNAPVYIQDGDFWVYVKNKKPALAILFQQNNTQVDQIQGPLNNREIPPEDVYLIQELIDSGQLPNMNDRTKQAIKDATDKQRILEERLKMYPGFVDVTAQLFERDVANEWVSKDPRYSMLVGVGEEFKILRNADTGEIIAQGQFSINEDCPSLVFIDNELDEDGRTPYKIRIQTGVTLANLKKFNGVIVKVRRGGEDLNSPTQAVNFPALEEYKGNLVLVHTYGVNNDVEENRNTPDSISHFPKLRTYHGGLTMDGRETHMPVLEDIRGGIKAQHVSVNSLPSFRRILEDDFSAGNRGERISEFNACYIPTLIEIRVANLERTRLDSVTTSNAYITLRRGSSMNALVAQDGEALVSDTSQMLSLRNVGGLNTDVDNDEGAILPFSQRFPALEHVQQRIFIDNEDLKISNFPKLRSCGGLQHVFGTVLAPQLLECNGSWQSGTKVDAPLCEFITGAVTLEDNYGEAVDSLSLVLSNPRLETNKARAQAVKEYEQNLASYMAGAVGRAEQQRTVFDSLKSIGDEIQIRGNVTLPLLNRVSNQDMVLEGNVSMPALRRIEARHVKISNGVHLPNLEFCKGIRAEHCHLPMLADVDGQCTLNNSSAPQLILVDGQVNVVNAFLPRLKYVRGKVSQQDTIFPQLLVCDGFSAVYIRNDIPPAPKLKYCMGEMNIATYVDADRLTSSIPLKEEGVQFPALEFVGSDITANYPIIAPKLTTVMRGAQGFFVAPALDVVGGFVSIRGNAPMKMTDNSGIFRTVSLKDSVPLLLKQKFTVIEKETEITIGNKVVNTNAVTLRRPRLQQLGTYEDYLEDPGEVVRLILGTSPETISFTKEDFENLGRMRFLYRERIDAFVEDQEKIYGAIARAVDKRRSKLQFSKASVPASGVFDASKPPISSEPIFAVMNADGTIYYDRSATMHGDLVEAFPEIADTTIDGGFIINGKYKMSTSDGGFSALEGTDEQIQQVKEFARQANTAVAITEQEGTTSVDDQGGATQGLFDPQSGLHFLVADELTEQTAPAVLAHEVTHGVSTPEMEESALDLVANRDVATNSEDLFEFLQRVAQRMDSAGVVGNGAEAMGYIVEEALIAGRQDGFSVIDDTLFGKIVDRFGETVADLVKKFVAWVRARLAEKGADLQLSVDDMLAIAERGMHRASRGGAESRSPTATTFKTSNSVRDQSYSQADTGGADRGRFNPKTMTTTLTKLADLSTFLHESGHFWLESLAFAASLPSATDQQKADFQAVLDWFGVADKAAWDALSMDEKRQHHEAWAYNVEIYFSEGKAPSIALEGVFARYAKWLGKIYTNIRDELNAIYRKENGKDLPMLTGEIRQVMDRVLASQQQIEHAAAVRNMVPMYQTQEQSGMNDMEWKEYQDLAEEWRLAAIVDLTKASMRQIQWLSNARSRVLANLQKEHDKIRKQVKAEVEEEVRVEPLYRAMNYLKTGVMVNAKGEEVTSDGKHRIDIDMILKMYSLEPDVLKPNLTALTRGKYRMIGKDGAHPDALAGLFGFDSGDRMIRALMGARSYKDEVVARTDARMLAEYGDMNTPAAQQAAVERALHTEARSRFVAVELRFLTKISQPVRVMIDAARRAAQQTIDSTVIRQLRPGDFSNAEARAGKEADEALRAVDRKRKTPDQIEEEAYKESLATQIAAGVDDMTADGVAVKAGLDARKAAEAREAAYQSKYKGKDPLETAITAKQRQLLNNQLAEVAIDVRDDIDAGVRYLRKVLNPKNIKRMGADTSDQIAKILSFYSLRKLTAEEAANKLTLQQWLKEQEELGIVPNIDPALLDEANRKSFQELTVAEFRELVETVEQLEYIARNADKARIAGEKVKFGEERDALTESIIENKRGRMGEMPRTENTAGRRAAAKGRMFFADHLKVAFIARIFDGDKDGGKMWNWFIRTANICGDKETSMIAAATKVIMKALEPVKALGNMEGDARFFPTIGMSLTRGERFVIALNMGNEGNMQRLQDGFGWTDAQLEPVIATISSTEWEAVQKIWDHFATYKDEVGAMERRLNGKEPTWIEIRPITVKTSDGKTMTLDGGYYPIKYDPRASDRVEQEMDSDAAKAAQRGAFTAATTRQSYTKSRADKVTGRKLLLNMTGVWGGLGEVIHDLSWREWLIHANRMARDPKFTETVSKAYGFEIKQQIKKWIKAIAEGNSAQQEGYDVFATLARQAVSVARLGFNAMSGVMQVSGLVNSVVRIGAKWTAVGMWTYAQNPRASIRGVNEKSSMMRNLSMTQFRDLNEIKNVAQDQDGLWKKSVANAYIFCKVAQSIVNYPTWEGAYAKALHSGANDQLAIDMADQAVIDSQGSGQLKDLATVQRGGAWQKLFTVFMDYQNSLYGQMSVQVMTKSRVRAAANLTLLVVVPAVLKYYQKQLLQPQRDDEEEETGLAQFVAEESVQTVMGTMIGVRELSGMVKFDQSRRDYSGPTGLSTLTDLYRLGDQVVQNEWDAAYRRALLNAAGDLFGVPSVQINRTLDGIDYMMENETADPRAIIFGTRAK